MGKVYKTTEAPVQSNPSYPITNLYKNIISDTCSDKHPQIYAQKNQEIPQKSFETILKQAEFDIENNNLNQALKNLLEIDLSHNNPIRVHELLADLYLKLGNLILAKKHCHICAQLIQQETPTEIFSIKDFRILLSEAGDFIDIQQEFETIKKLPITPENYHHGTKIALNLATHYIAQKQYQTAELLLLEYRNQYLEYLTKEFQ